MAAKSGKVLSYLKEHSLAFILIISSTLVKLVNIGYLVYNYDEATYVGTIESFSKGYVSLTAALSSGNAQMPLFFFLSLPFYHYSVYVGRVVSVIFSGITLFLIYTVAYRFVSKRAGIIATIVLSLDYVYFRYSRLSTLDITYTTFLLAYLFSFYYCLDSRKRKYALLSGVLLGLSIMTKIVGLIGAFFLIFAIFTRTHKSVSDKRLNLISVFSLLIFTSLLSILFTIILVGEYTYISLALQQNIALLKISISLDPLYILTHTPFYVSMYARGFSLTALYAISLVYSLIFTPNKETFLKSFKTYILLATLFLIIVSSLGAVRGSIPVIPLSSLFVGYTFDGILSKFVSQSQIVKVSAPLKVIKSLKKINYALVSLVPILAILFTEFIVGSIYVARINKSYVYDDYWHIQGIDKVSTYIKGRASDDDYVLVNTHQPVFQTYLKDNIKVWWYIWYTGNAVEAAKVYENGTVWYRKLFQWKDILEQIRFVVLVVPFHYYKSLEPYLLFHSYIYYSQPFLDKLQELFSITYVYYENGMPLIYVFERSNKTEHFNIHFKFDDFQLSAVTRYFSPGQTMNILVSSNRSIEDGMYKIQLQIYNSLGKKVLNASKEIKRNSAIFEYFLPLSAPPGYYITKVDITNTITENVTFTRIGAFIVNTLNIKSIDYGLMRTGSLFIYGELEWANTPDVELKSGTAPRFTNAYCLVIDPISQVTLHHQIYDKQQEQSGIIISEIEMPRIVKLNSTFNIHLVIKNIRDAAEKLELIRVDHVYEDQPLHFSYIEFSITNLGEEMFLGPKEERKYIIKMSLNLKNIKADVISEKTRKYTTILFPSTTAEGNPLLYPTTIAGHRFLIRTNPFSLGVDSKTTPRVYFVPEEAYGNLVYEGIVRVANLGFGFEIPASAMKDYYKIVITATGDIGYDILNPIITTVNDIKYACHVRSQKEMSIVIFGLLVSLLIIIYTIKIRS